MKKPVKRKKKVTKVHSLALGTGYAEDSSWSHLILVNGNGFDCIQDALVNIHGHLLRLCTQEQEDHNSHVEMMNRWAKEGGREPNFTAINSDPAEAIEETLREIIHGNYQDHGDFWEMISQDWLAGSAWVGDEVARHGMCFIDRSPEMVVQSITWGDKKPAIDYDCTEEDWPMSIAKSYMYHIPKGTKVFRSELK